MGDAELVEAVAFVRAVMMHGDKDSKSYVDQKIGTYFRKTADFQYDETTSSRVTESLTDLKKSDADDTRHSKSKGALEIPDFLKNLSESEKTPFRRFVFLDIATGTYRTAPPTLDDIHNVLLNLGIAYKSKTSLNNSMSSIKSFENSYEFLPHDRNKIKITEVGENLKSSLENGIEQTHRDVLKNLINKSISNNEFVRV